MVAQAVPLRAASGRGSEVKRSFLFLQGPCTPFFRLLANKLKADGHCVHRVNFCAGDAVYWGPRNSSRFGGTPDHCSDFLKDLCARLSITDLILFGDQRAVHRPAVEQAQNSGIRTHVFEEGYFRPLWVTLERDGVNNHSRLPRDPAWFHETATRLPALEKPQTFASPFFQRAVHDVIYHVAGMLNPLAFSRYQTHAGMTAPVEYAGYIRRFALLRLIRERECNRAKELIQGKQPYFVLPLQLNSDAQIREHSAFQNMEDVIEYVLGSFARHAPSDALMVIRNHPLDMGLMPYEDIIRSCEKRFELAGRVHFLEDGDTNALIANASGMVTVNSTSGMIGLGKNTPTLALSDPIYNLAGLTSQMPLDEFWTRHTPPDPEFFKRFRRCVIHATQVNGGFYSRPGMDLAIENSIQALTDEHSPLERLL